MEGFKMNKDLTMEKLVSLCKNYGFIFQGSEIYGGLANTWDYGPLGKELKENFVNEIARSIVKDIDTLYIVGTQKDETRNTYITRYVATEFTPNVYLLQEKLCEMTKERCKLVCINANAETKREIIKKHPK